MKIKEHSELHVVKLDDNSEWQIFPADLDLTLGWLPTTELDLIQTNAEEIGTHELVDSAERTRVRVLPVGHKWPMQHAKKILKEG